ncbi:MAG: helix-turn-helix domain-containing protein [Victivallales bacterium]|nr:helix-turn-helix domain-containing protein [Victivallales bacterium]MCF7888623.1 helix-turn-helix domain-containing protein [Victivallales bacterium]
MSKNNEHKFFGSKLKLLRRRRHITIRELSQFIGKTPRTIGSWERNERRPSISDIKILADIMGINANEISDIEDSQAFRKTKIFNSVLSTEDKMTELFETKLNIEQKVFLRNLFNQNKRTLHSEKVLEKELDRYRTVINSTPLAVYMKDSFRRYKLVNKYFIQLSNIPYHNIIGNTDYHVLPKEYKTVLEKVEDKVFKSLNPVYFYNASITENNYKKYLNITVIPIIENNKIVSLTGFIADISGRMNAVQNYKIIEHAIKQVSTVLWVRYKNPVPHVVFLNSGIEEIFGRSQKEFNRNPNIWKELVHPDDQLRVKRWTDQWIKSPENKNINNSMSYRIIDNKGKIKKVIDKRSIYLSEEGEQLICGSVSVITEDM